MKSGKTSNGKARFRWQPREQGGRTFLRSDAYPGCRPTVKPQIVERTRKGSGIREIVRVLQVGPNMVLKELKKSRRPLAGQHQRGGRLVSGRAHGRSAARGSGGGR